MIRFTTAVALTALAGALAPAADSPAYTAWAKFPVGTTMTLTTVVEAGPAVKNESVMTTTLTALTPDKLTVTMGAVTKVAGQEFKSPSTPVDYPRAADAAAGVPTPAAGQAKPVEEGVKDITVLGKVYKAKYAKYNSDDAQGPGATEIWSSDEVPGTILKLVVNKKMGDADYKSTMTLTNFTLGK